MISTLNRNPGKSKAVKTYVFISFIAIGVFFIATAANAFWLGSLEYAYRDGMIAFIFFAGASDIERLFQSFISYVHDKNLYSTLTTILFTVAGVFFLLWIYTR